MAAKKTQNKSDFIRSQPDTMSVAEVVAKGKAEGVKFSSQLVYNVRNAKSKNGTAKKATKPGAAGISKSPAKLNKSDFIRARAHLSPKEIVEDAKVAGMTLDVAYVYNVRGAAKARPKTKATRLAARRPTARAAPYVARPIGTPSTKAEGVLRAVASEVGLARAIEILAEERARVRAVLQG